MKKAFLLYLLSALFLSAFGQNPMASVKLDQEWKIEVPAMNGESASCYGNLKTDSHDHIWMILNSGYTNDILYQIDPDGKFMDTLLLPSEEVSSINSFDIDGNGFVYVVGTSKVDTKWAMAVAKIEISTGKLIWKKEFTGEEDNSNPFGCTLSWIPSGKIAVSWKDAEKNGIGLSVLSPDGDVLHEKVYEDLAEGKCLMRDAAVSDNELALVGETYSNEGIIAVFDINDFQVKWHKKSKDLMPASQGMIFDQGKVVIGGSSAMNGNTQLAIFDSEGSQIRKNESHPFVTGFGVEKSKEGFYLVGGGMGINPYAEYTSFPLVTVFDSEGSFAGIYSETAAWAGSDSYIVCSASLSDHSYLAAISSSKGDDPTKIYLCKYATQNIERKQQEIEWNQNLSTMKHNETLELSAKASSGLEVSYFTNDGYNEVYVENGVLKVKPSFAESCPEGYTFQIFAYQLGNDEYMPAELITKSIRIEIGDVETETSPMVNETASHLRYDISQQALFTENIQEGWMVGIYNLSGKLIRQISLNGNNQRIDVSDLVSGVYIARIENLKESATKFVVK